jgi:hypothetical protein
MIGDKDNAELVVDGDAGFIGVNQVDQAAALAQGEVVDCKNGRFRNRKSEARLGLSNMNWTTRQGSGWSGAVPLPFVPPIYGAGRYRDESDNIWGLVAAEGKIFVFREGSEARSLTLPAGEVVSYTVSFTQTVNGLICFRGTSRAEWVLKSLDLGFQAMVQESNTITGEGTENPSDGTVAIPNASSGAWLGNRLFVPHETDTEKDLLGISDFFNATRMAPVRSQARINQGSADRLVLFFPYTDNAGLAFKGASVYALYGLQLDLSDMRLAPVTTEYGLAAAKSVVHVGKESADGPSAVWYLSQLRGVCAIVATDNGILQVASLPASAAIQRLVERIDWRYASAATGTEWDNKYYLAVPLDDSICHGPELLASTDVYTAGVDTSLVVPGVRYSWVKSTNDTSLVNGSETLTESGEFTAQSDVVTLNGTAAAVVTASLKRVFEGVNNAVLVYDRIRDRWAGYDQATGLAVFDWVKLPYQGKERLFAICQDGFLRLMEEFFYDETAKESVGANLVVGSYSGGGASVVVTTAGRHYSWVKGGSDTNVVNGTETLTATGTFVAQGASVTLHGTALAAVTARVRLVSWTDGLEWIEHDVTYRGYTGGMNQRKRWLYLKAQVETWNPEFEVSVLVDGVAEEFAVATRTKNLLKYYRPAGEPDWDRTNVNDDHGQAYREDYAVILDDTTVASGSIVAGVLYFVESTDVTTACSILYNGVSYTNQTTFTGVAGVATFSVTLGTPVVYGPGSYFLPGVNGFDPDRHQETPEDFTLPRGARGRECEVRIRCTQGRCVVKSLGVKGVLVDEVMGTKS